MKIYSFNEQRAIIGNIGAGRATPTIHLGQEIFQLRQTICSHKKRQNEYGKFKNIKGRVF